MGNWPQTYTSCWTLSAETERSGVGLHSGAQATVRLAPADRPGFWLGWLNRPELPLQRLQPAQVVDARLCTALELDGGRLATVEHLLAALAGTGITQAEIWVEGPEIPLLDGSALPWVEAIAEAGLTSVAGVPVAPTPAGPLTLQQGSSFITALPAEGLVLAAAIDFSEPAIGRQLLAVSLTPERFVAEIAPARTFGLRAQVEQLLAAGLIQGGGLDNALVCDGEQWLNPPLRFADEPVRHKLLDLIGDLALVGLPRAQVFAYRGSHGLHTALAAALADLPSPPA